MLRIIIPFASICYAALTFYILHVDAVRRINPRMGLTDLLVEGAVDIVKNPFAIFPISRSTITSLLAWTGIAVAAAVMFWVLVDLRKRYNPDKVQGEQRKLNQKDLAEYNKKYSDPLGKREYNGPNNIILSKEMRLSLNTMKTRRNLNVFIIGGSGSGKTFGYIGPNLMQANTSYVITDPSGGTYAKYGTFLESMGYRVRCFNLDRMNEGCKYNPFHYLKSEKDVEILVKTLILNTTPPGQHGGDPFWEKSETALLAALIAYLVERGKEDKNRDIDKSEMLDEKDQSFTGVLKLLRAAEIREQNDQYESELDTLMKNWEREYPDSFACKQYRTFKAGAGKTAKSILISCMVRLQAFDIPQLAQLTNTDELELDTIGDQKTALFVIIPTGESGTFNFVASLMYSQLFQQLYSYAQNEARYSYCILDKHKNVVKTFRAATKDREEECKKKAEAFFSRIQKGKLCHKENLDADPFQWWEVQTCDGELVTFRGTQHDASEALNAIKGGSIVANMDLTGSNGTDGHLPIHTRLMLDEFPNTGQIPEFSERVATIRKYWISVDVVVQAIGQLKRMYPEDWETIPANCDTTVFLGTGADTESSDWISKLAGKETRKAASETYSKGGGSTNLSTVSGELFSPAALRTLNENKCVVIARALYPLEGTKHPAPEHPRYAKVSEFQPYLFKREKIEEILEADTAARVEDSFQIDEAQEEENKAAIEARNKMNRENARAYENNRDENAEKVIGDPEPIANLADKMDISSEKDVDESYDQSWAANEGEDWGVGELTFGVAPADQQPM